MELPLSNDALIAETRKEHEVSLQQGRQTSAEAGIRYTWALVHSPNQGHVWQGLSMAESLIGAPELKPHQEREAVYLSAVAKYKLGKHVEAKRQVAELLKVAPGMRQAQSLYDILESTLAKEALIGVGLGVGLLGIAGLVIAGMASKR